MEKIKFQLKRVMTKKLIPEVPDDEEEEEKRKTPHTR